MYNIAFEDGGKTRVYCTHWLPHRDEAERYLKRFIERYGNGDTDLRPFPNGRGFYLFRNPRIVTKVELRRARGHPKRWAS